MNKKIIFLVGYIVCIAGILFAQSRPLTEEELEQLSYSVSAPPILDIDVVLQRTEVQFANEAAVTKKMVQDNLELLKEKFPGKTITAKPLGTFLSTGEYEIVSQERIRISGLGSFRNDVQYYDSLSGEIKENITNIGRKNTYFVISNLTSRMEIYDTPMFPLYFDVLTYGTPNYSAEVTTDILSELKAVKSKCIKKQKEFYIHTTDSQHASKIIECLDMNKKKLYEMRLDPNDLGVCHELLFFDVDSGKPKKKIEFNDFVVSKDFVRPYPQKTVTTYFTGNNVTKQEIVNTTTVGLLKNDADIFDPQKELDNKKVDIMDHRKKLPHDVNESGSMH